LLPHRIDGPTPTYKKSAITYGLSFAQGEIIMTTDADCLVKPQWVESMVSQYDEETGMVAGIIAYERSTEKSLLHKLQTLEFSGLVFAGVGAVGINSPIICNGSNLSYRRKAFEEVGGFQGHDHLPSGDDDLLMQNLHNRTNWKIKYNLSPQAVNYTQPAANVKKFLQQRSRWASKGAHYPGFKIFAMLLAVYLFYFALFLCLPLALLGWFSLKIWLIGFSLKIIPEILIVRKALLFLNRRDLLPYIFVAEILQIPYILIAGFRGFFKLFKWNSL
ncbi:MAG: glycosyltransferase family 2 protein, partial [Calditrichia bacterium]